MAVAQKQIDFPNPVGARGIDLQAEPRCFAGTFPRSGSENYIQRQNHHIDLHRTMPLVSITIIYGHTTGEVNGKYANMHEFPGLWNDAHAPTVVPSSSSRKRPGNKERVT